MTRPAYSLLLCLLLALAACGQEPDVEGDPPTWSFYTMSPAALPQAQADTVYSEVITVGGKLAEPGQQPLVWQVTAGALPPGLGLGYSATTSNTISGQATQPGTFHFTLRVRSQYGTADASFSRVLNVMPVGNLVVTTTSLPDGTAGAAYSQWIDAAGGTGVGYTWRVVSGALPPGLALDARLAPLPWGGFVASGQLDLSLGAGALSRASGICASRRNPGILWVHDDTGSGADLYAVDAGGTVRQRYSLGVATVDLEDIALGPGPDPTREYLYLADAGDSAASRADCRLLRLEEPLVPAAPGATIVLSTQSFYFVYPGGAQDCRTLLIDWLSGTPYLVEATSAQARVHRFPMPLDAAWQAANPVTLQQVATGGGFAASGLTGGDASRDGNRVILRGGSGGTEHVRPAGGSFADIFQTAGSAVSMPGGQQYEALCYSADGTQLFTTTELAGASSAPLHMALAAPDNGLTTISGTPAGSGTWSFIVQVCDSAGNTASRAFTIVIP